tara:strand:+ start:5469 stop:6269 length:801 start_codon:yes stop_codon:yes gene_type:complete
MSATRKFKLFGILISFLVMSLVGCNSRHIEYERAMLPYNSFTKIETSINVHLCLEIEGEKECRSTTGKGSGSGTIIKHWKDKSYILSAAHVCDNSDQREFWEQRGGSVTISSIAIDFRGSRHQIEGVVIIDKATDLCVLQVDGIIGEEAHIGRIAPKIGDKVFNVAAPQGDSAPGMAAVLEGRFSGFFQFRGTSARSAYTIPAIGGSSGSGVFNSKGQLIGMIHSVRRNFHHLSYGPTHDELMHFLKSLNGALADFGQSAATDAWF